MGTDREMPGVLAVIVLTAAGGTPDDCAIYRRIIEAQQKKCAEYGYRHLIYDLGGLGIGEPYAVEREDLEPTVNGDSLPPATFKAALVERAMCEAKHGELVCWLDADCIPLKPFLPLQHGGMFDAAVTLRPAPEVGLSNNAALDYLNSGVVWIRNSKLGVPFAEAWRMESLAMKTDQGALNEIVAPRVHQAVTWNAMRGKVHYRVLVLDCAEWNSWHPPFTGARIAHFKRGLRGQAVNYL